MKLNLGCGDDIRPGYTNVDFRKTDASVLEADLSVFPWPFADNSADEIMMLDFLEHFPYGKTHQILMECHRVLRPGASLVVQVPDAEILASTFVGSERTRYQRFQCNKCGFWMNTNVADIGDEKCGKCGQLVMEIQRAAMMRMFGGQDYTGNFHYACFTQDMLSHIAGECGFQGMAIEEQEHQAANWNFKARFGKADLW